MTERPSVLFLCVHNAGRSLAAKVLLEHYAAGRVHVRSAGSEPGTELNPAVVAVLAERGLDTAKELPKLLVDGDARQADVVVTMGCGDTCPRYPGARHVDWDLPDPAGLAAEQVRPIVDDIDRRVRALLAELVATDQAGSTTPPTMVPSDRPDIRAYQPADQVGLTRLVASVLAEFGFAPDPLLEADLDQADTAYDAVWVAADHGTIVGSVAIRLTEEHTTAELKRMYLLPAHRGRGLGRALLDHALDWARDHRCEAIILGTATAMTSAQRLYEAAGFVRTGSRTETGAHDSRCEVLYRLHLRSPR